MPNIPDWLPGRWRDFPTASSVPTGMTLALRPRPTWRPSLLAMAAVDPASEPTGPSSSNADEPSRPSSSNADEPSRPSSSNADEPSRPSTDNADEPSRPSSSNADEPSRPDRARPDADVLELRPEQQLAAITRRHADAVYRVALSVTRDPDLAEDVAQDALLKAWQALPSFRSDAPLKNWLLRITHNTAISALRRRREVRVDPDELPEAPTPRHHTLEAQVESRLALDQFEAALADLDELSRAIVVLREVEGLSYDEITEVLDVPLPTVKTRLLRARRQLATALEGWRP